MSKISFRPIIDNNELDKFLSMTEHYSGVRLPQAYAKNAKVVGAYIGSSLSGGYLLVTRPEFRALMFVPDKCKRTHAFFRNDDYEMMEVNALWVGHAFKTPTMQLRFWTHLVFDIFFTRKKYLLLMSNPKNKAIQSIHKMTNPTILYQGAPELMQGQTSHEEIRVSYTTRWNLLLNFPRYLREAGVRRRRIQLAKEARRIAGFTKASGTSPSH